MDAMLLELSRLKLRSRSYAVRRDETSAGHHPNDTRDVIRMRACCGAHAELLRSVVENFRNSNRRSLALCSRLRRRSATNDFTACR